MNRTLSTDEIDQITSEERKALVAFCDIDEEWWKFTDDGTLKPKCPKCGGKASTQIGFQIITQRTFDPKLHGKKKLKKRLR